MWDLATPAAAHAQMDLDPTITAEHGAQSRYVTPYRKRDLIKRDLIDGSCVDCTSRLCDCTRSRRYVDMLPLLMRRFF